MRTTEVPTAVGEAVGPVCGLQREFLWKWQYRLGTKKPSLVSMIRSCYFWFATRIWMWDNSFVHWTGAVDEWSARRRDFCLTTHNTHRGQTPMPPQTQQASSRRPARPPNLLVSNSLHKIWNTRNFYISNKVRGRANSSDCGKPSLSVRNQYLTYFKPDNGKSYTFPNNVFSFWFRDNGKRERSPATGWGGPRGSG
jgi:hypothetical protein